MHAASPISQLHLYNLDVTYMVVLIWRFTHITIEFVLCRLGLLLRCVLRSFLLLALALHGIVSLVPGASSLMISISDLVCAAIYGRTVVYYVVQLYEGRTTCTAQCDSSFAIDGTLCRLYPIPVGTYSKPLVTNHVAVNVSRIVRHVDCSS